MKRTIVVVFAIAASALLMSCMRVPEAQIQEAEAALEAAEAAGAQTYAPDAWNRAEQAMERLNAEVSVQEEKFRLFRNFKTATALAD
jgi:hypothetical protein